MSRSTYTYQKNEKGEFVCHLCGVTKKNQNTMHYHYKRHEGRLPFQCDICNKEFLQASVLELHKAARHAKETHAGAEKGGVSCPACEFHTLTKANCIIHFVRNHCGSAMERMLGATTVVKSSKEFECSTCSKSCKSRTAFLYHIATKGCLSLSSEVQQQQLETLLEE